MLIRAQHPALEERHPFLQHRAVARDGDIACRAIAEPYGIIRNPAADSLTRPRQPPMLHVSLSELPRRGMEQMRARDIGPCPQESQAVLELIAKPEGAACLVEAA